MNQKELSELRRRFKPERNAISRIYGCYVSAGKEIISELDQSLGLMPQEEGEKYLALLKKTLSGTLGRNLVDIEFATQQVVDSEEHRMLSALRACALQDEELRRGFYRKVMETLDMGESNYLILLAHDAYDVPYRGKDDVLQADASDQVYTYIVCCVCPVKDGRLELGYFPMEHAFHCVAGQTVSPPEVGFLFPAFDDRAANLYNALYYARDPDELHQEFIDAVFRTQAPFSAAQQREAFQSALSEALEEECSLDVVYSVQEELREKIKQHKELKDPEPLTVTTGELGGILQSCGVPQERVTVFKEKCKEQLGEDAVLPPGNLIESNRFLLKTEEVVIHVDPEHSHLVETRIINGRKYILIPADKGVELNGFPVDIAQPAAKSGAGV